MYIHIDMPTMLLLQTCYRSLWSDLSETHSFCT